MSVSFLKEITGVRIRITNNWGQSKVKRITGVRNNWGQSKVKCLTQRSSGSLRYRESLEYSRQA